MAKKSFKNNPALRFISASVPPSPQEEEQRLPPASPAPAPVAPPHPHPMKPNPLYVETKSRRLNLLIQPSLHDRIKAVARERGASVNDTIHQILQEYVDSN